MQLGCDERVHIGVEELRSCGGFLEPEEVEGTRYKTRVGEGRLDTRGWREESSS